MEHRLKTEKPCGMNFIICFFNKEKCKVKLKGNTLKLLVMLVSMSNAVTELIARENGIKMEDAIDFVSDCIKEGYKKLS